MNDRKLQTVTDGYFRITCPDAVFLHLSSKLKSNVGNHPVSGAVELSSTSGRDEELLVTSAGLSFGVQWDHLRMCCASCKEEESMQ